MTFERTAAEQYDTIPDVPEPVEHTELFGHREECENLARAYADGRLHHALILSGPKGIGKATLAFRFAWHVLAHPDAATAPQAFAAPDPASTTFRLMAQGAHPSLLHLTRPAQERGTGFKSAVTVDEIRRVGRFLSMTSHDGGWRVVVVDAADDMNRNAANALLKNLEEPPARTLFLLVTHTIGRILPTIRSRCRLMKMKPLESAELAAALESVAPGTAADDKVVERAAGSVREALLLTRFGGLDIAEAVDAVASTPRFDVVAAYRIADAVTGRDAAVQFQLFNEHAAAIAERRSHEAGMAGDIERAGRLAEEWVAIRRQTSEADAFNLDKRQHVVSLLRRLARAA